MKKYGIILFILIEISITATAQKGSIKIFSEIKGIDVYLDDIFQGYDIVSIDSVIPGSHYLKILKDSVAVYSELITVKENKRITILIKNTSQVKQKLLESKANEIQEYKSKKLDIILSQTYITQTKGISSSYYFPGYYIVTGNEYYNSVSTSSTYTDWKITKGGNKVISEIQFARLVGDKDIEKRYDKLYKDYQKKINKYNKKMNRSLAIGIPSIIITGIVAADLLGSKPFLNLSPTTEAIIGTGGILGSIIGFSNIKSDPPTFNYGHLTTVRTASGEAFAYNQALKKKLGLPENFEPKK